MNEAAKIVSGAIIKSDFEVAVVNKKAYIIYPPTIHKIAGAASYLSVIGKIETLDDIFRAMKDTPNASHALSWLINDNDDLYEELSKGEFSENIEALKIAFSLTSTENFLVLSSLARNVANLAALQK